jgi:hypothetical protein
MNLRTKRTGVYIQTYIRRASRPHKRATHFSAVAPEGTDWARMSTLTSLSCKKNANTYGAKEFAIAFVVSVTETSDGPNNWIAKNGKDSMFSILRDIFPEVMQD